jgi:hypothetical protein
VANHKKTRKARKPQHHLPKVGTPADDAYRMQHSREDLLDFGLARPRSRALTWGIAALVAVVVVAAVVALIALS